MTRGARQNICKALITIAMLLIVAALFVALPRVDGSGMPAAEYPFEIANRIRIASGILVGATGFAFIAAAMGFEFDG